MCHRHKDMPVKKGLSGNLSKSLNQFLLFKFDIWPWIKNVHSDLETWFLCVTFNLSRLVISDKISAILASINTVFVHLWPWIAPLAKPDSFAQNMPNYAFMPRYFRLHQFRTIDPHTTKCYRYFHYVWHMTLNWDLDFWLRLLSKGDNMFNNSC